MQSEFIHLGLWVHQQLALSLAVYTRPSACHHVPVLWVLLELENCPGPWIPGRVFLVLTSLVPHHIPPEGTRQAGGAIHFSSSVNQSHKKNPMKKRNIKATGHLLNWSQPEVTKRWQRQKDTQLSILFTGLQKMTCHLPAVTRSVKLIEMSFRLYDWATQDSNCA